MSRLLIFVIEVVQERANMELAAKSSFLLPILLHLHAYVFVNAECQTDWLHYGQSCYYFSNVTLYWIRAKESCRGYDAHLVEVTNKGQSDFLELTAKNLGGSGYWLGGRDAAREGKWTWDTSGLPFTYTDWSPGEPNNVGNEDCVLMWTAKSYKWNDSPCERGYNFICEKEYPLVATTTSPRTSSPSHHAQPVTPDIFG